MQKLSCTDGILFRTLAIDGVRDEGEEFRMNATASAQSSLDNASATNATNDAIVYGLANQPSGA